MKGHHVRRLGTGKGRRKHYLKHDYTVADEMFEELKDNVSLSHREICRRISDETGIKIKTLETRFYHRNWKVTHIHRESYQMPCYLSLISKVKEAVTHKTGITDFMSEEGQVALRVAVDMMKTQYHCCK